MKADKIRQFFSSDTLEKIIHHEWSFPPVEKFMPWFFAVVAGFLAATLMSLALATALMPKHPKSKDAKTSAKYVEQKRQVYFVKPLCQGLFNGFLIRVNTGLASEKALQKEGYLVDNI